MSKENHEDDPGHSQGQSSGRRLCQRGRHSEGSEENNKTQLIQRQACPGSRRLQRLARGPIWLAPPQLTAAESNVSGMCLYLPQAMGPSSSSVMEGAPEWTTPTQNTARELSPSSGLGAQGLRARAGIFLGDGPRQSDHSLPVQEP